MSDHRRPKRSNIDIVFSQGVVPVTKKAKTDTCSRRLPPKIRSLYNQANYCYDVVASADPDLRVRLWCFGCQKYMDLPQHKRDKKARSSYKHKTMKCLQIWLKDDVALVDQKLINWKQSFDDNVLQNAHLFIDVPIEKLQLLVASLETAVESTRMMAATSETEEMPPSGTNPHDTNEMPASEMTPAIEIVTVVDNDLDPATEHIPLQEEVHNGDANPPRQVSFNQHNFTSNNRKLT
jgi:hypothetical protein